MNANAAALALVRQVGETPGFKQVPLRDGAFRLIRLSFPGLNPASIKVRTRGNDQSAANNTARARRELFWTPELRAALDDIARRHRIEGTDPTPDIDAKLAEAFGLTEESGPVLPEQKKITHRHNGGGTATGSAKPARTAAKPATPPAPEEPQVLTGEGQIVPELITPERAIELLDRVANYQRKLRKEKVQVYAAAMRRGEWMLNASSPLCLDINGKLSNGLHRLNAVIESEHPQPFYVARDVPPEVYQHMDRGLKRTTVDALHGAGEANAPALSSVVKQAWLWFNVEEQHRWSRTEVSEPQVFATLEEHPGLRDSVRLGGLNKLGLNPTAAMFVHYLISQVCGGHTHQTTAWYRAMEKMTLGEGHPGHTLGLYLMQTDEQRRKDLGRTKREIHMYLLLKAWNNTALGKRTTSVTPRKDFVIPGPIPLGPKSLPLPQP